MDMVFESNGYGVREQGLLCSRIGLWCERVMVMVLNSNSSGVREQGLLCEGRCTLQDSGPLQCNNCVTTVSQQCNNSVTAV
jgi:hypothetical protein